MHPPGFITVMGTEPNRARLLMGTQSGYVIAIAFAALCLVAQLTGVAPMDPWFYVLVAAKLLTNTLARLALYFNKLELALGGANTIMDIIVMTGAIYLTGGQLSPLFPIYVIELTVIALLTNLGVTVLVVVIALVLYAGMAVLTFLGLVPFHPPPLGAAQSISGTYLALDLVFSAFVLGVPTFFTSAILRQLRSKEVALEQRRRDIVEANRQKSQFMANVTHELRTPIHGILGLADLVATGIYGPVTEKQKYAQQQIKNSAKALLKLIDDLLQLARADAGKLAYSPTEVDVEEAITSVVASTKWMIGTQNLDLRVELPSNLPSVVTDRTMLAQVLLNLLSNAVKFTPEGGRITLTARASDDGNVIITVRDTGIGIPEDQQQAIFEQFRQVDGSMERTYGGVGLGLSLVRRLVGVMGGTIELTSTPGGGSTFTVTLPVAGPTEAHVTQEIRRNSVLAITARFDR